LDKCSGFVVISYAGIFQVTERMEVNFSWGNKKFLGLCIIMGNIRMHFIITFAKNNNFLKITFSFRMSR
jgi:hypothetical protein